MFKSMYPLNSRSDFDDPGTTGRYRGRRATNVVNSRSPDPATPDNGRELPTVAL